MKIWYPKNKEWFYSIPEFRLLNEQKLKYLLLKLRRVSCNKSSYEICKHITKIHQFESSSTSRICSITPQNLNCASKNVVYLFTCKTGHKQFTRSTEDFRSRFNNYRRLHRNFLMNKKVKQESFHAHFAEGLHQGESDWEVRLIDQGVS